MNEKPSFFSKLKKKWGIESNFQIVLILITFSLAGSSIVFFRETLFTLLGYNEETSIWVKVITYIVLMIPTYQILLLVYGSILGQFHFFWSKQKTMFNRMKRRGSN